MQKSKQFIFKTFLIFISIILLSNEVVLSKNIDKDKEFLIAIVIDDFGYGAKGTEEMLKLPIPITAAVIPFLERSKYDADLAVKSGKEVIIHMPMEANTSNHCLGKNPILISLSNDEIRKRVDDAFKEINVAKGMNNHMGSRATSDERVMSNVLDIVKEKGVFYLDSKTSQKSKVEKLCKEKSIPYYTRDVFLDHINTQANVEKELEKAYDIAKKKGKCIVIGHVGAQGGNTTINGIKNKIGKLQEKGVKFVFLSQIACE